MLDLLKNLARNLQGQSGVIESGKMKKTGGHDHRTNTGDNRTPSQKQGDKSRRKA